VYSVIEMYAGVDGVSRIPERQIAALLGIGRHRVRTAKMRLERGRCINVIPGSRQPDGRLLTATFQLTTGAFSHLWHRPCPRRQKAHETFAKRAQAMPDRRPDLVEKLAQARGRAQERALERALERSGARPGENGSAPWERAQGARPRKNEVLSKGGRPKGAPPPTDDYEERERLYQELTGEDLGAPLPHAPDPTPLPLAPETEEQDRLTHERIEAIRERYKLPRKRT
jgi:hypothetical protein